MPDNRNYKPQSQVKYPYTRWGKWLLSNTAKRIRSALGMRVDENFVNTTYRTNDTIHGVQVDDEELVCHHFEQDADTADCVHFTMKGGSLVINVPAGKTTPVIKIVESDGSGKQMDKEGVWTDL